MDDKLEVKPVGRTMFASGLGSGFVMGESCGSNGDGLKKCKKRAGVIDQSGNYRQHDDGEKNRFYSEITARLGAEILASDISKPATCVAGPT
jgi:hypothetical protein